MNDYEAERIKRKSCEATLIKACRQLIDVIGDRDLLMKENTALLKDIAALTKRFNDLEAAYLTITQKRVE